MTINLKKREPNAIGLRAFAKINLIFLILLGFIFYSAGWSKSSAQTASILPPAKTSFYDANGNPLTAGTVTSYIPGTTTKKTTWQDAAETIPNQNPLTLDAAGRALLLGSGSYRQVVKDKLGNLIWDQVTSSSGSGGGSGPVVVGDGDAVGTIKPYGGLTAPSQYVFAYGQEVSRTTYAAAFTALTSAQAAFCTSGSPILTGLGDTTNFWIGSTVEASCLAAGFSTIISKTSTTVTLAVSANVTTNTTATFLPWGRGNGSTTFNIPDFRGIVPAGNNNMGGTASANLSATYFGATDPNSAGAFGGSQSKVLVAANLPAHTHAGTTGIESATHTHQYNQAGPLIAAGNFEGGSIRTITQTATASGVESANHTHSFTTDNGPGTSTAFSLIQPTKTVNYIVKIVPDEVNPIFGVTNITIGTTTVSSGVDKTLLYNNAGILDDTSSVVGPILAATPNAVNGTGLTSTLFSFLNGGSGSQAVTTKRTPTVLISRIESITSDGTTDGSDGPGLFVGSTNTSGTQQNVAITGVGSNSSTSAADVVGMYGAATQSGTGSHTAYGGFFYAAANTAGSRGFGLEIDSANNTLSDAPYTGLSPYPSLVGIHVQALGANLNTAGVWIGNIASAPLYDVGTVLTAGSVKTTGFQDDSSSVNVLKATGTHTNGVDFSSASITGNMLSGPGHLVDITGAGSIKFNGFNFAYGTGTTTPYNQITDTAGNGAIVLGGGGVTPDHTSNYRNTTHIFGSIGGAASYLTLVDGASGVRFPAYGAGILTTNGSGTITASTTPALGAPSSVTLTNATGLPLTTGVTGTLPRANGGGATSVAGEQAALSTGLLVFALPSANFNTTADQAIAITLPAGFTRYRIQGLFITNPSISMTTAVGGFYTSPSKAGIPIVPAGQVYSALTTNTAGASGSMLNPAVLNGTTAFYNSSTLYLSLTTPQGTAATADITVFIQPLP